MVYGGSVVTCNGLKLLLYNDDDSLVWRMLGSAGIVWGRGLKGAEVDVQFPEGCEKDRAIIFGSLCKNSG